MACRSLCDEVGKHTEKVASRMPQASRQRDVHEQSHKHAVFAGNSFNDIETGWMKASAVMVVGYATGCIAMI